MSARLLKERLRLRVQEIKLNMRLLLFSGFFIDGTQLPVGLREIWRPQKILKVSSFE
jgi:hypothetical protein